MKQPPQGKEEEELLLQKTVEGFQELLKVEPRALNAFVELGQIALFVKNPREAFKYFEQFLRIEPDYPPVLFLYANCLFLLENYSEALRQYQHFTSTALDYYESIDPGSPQQRKEREKDISIQFSEAVIMKGQCFYQLQDYAEAIFQFNLVIASKLNEITSSRAKAHYHSAVVHDKLGDLHRAVEHLNKAINYADSYAEAYQHRSHCYKMLGELEKARDDENKYHIYNNLTKSNDYRDEFTKTLFSVTEPNTSKS